MVKHQWTKQKKAERDARIREALEKTALPLRTLAKRLGVNVSTITRLQASDRTERKPE